MVETLRVQQGVWQMQLAVGRAARSLGWDRLCNAPVASRWFRHHHTQGGCSKGVPALLTAELEFGFRILPLPPSQQPLPIDRCWRSRGNLRAIPSLACFTCCHLCHVTPHCWSENSSFLVQILQWPGGIQDQRSFPDNCAGSRQLEGKKKKKKSAFWGGAHYTRNENVMFALSSVLPLTVCSFSFCFLSLKK